MPLAEVTTRPIPANDASSAPAARKPAAGAPAAAAKPAVKPAPVAAPAAPPVPAEAALAGRMDAVDNGQLFGWVWDRNRPDSRLLVRILLDAVEVASGIADKPRVDLRRNGIGDGHHAFAIDLPQQALQSPERLTVIAVSVNPAAELVLRRPSADEKAAEAAVAAPMAKVLDRLDLLVAAQRQLQLGQRDTGVLLKEAATRLDALSDKETALEEALDTVRGGQGDLNQRLDQMEIFLTRFDTALAGFDKRLETLAAQGRNEIKPQFFALAVLIGTGIGLALALGLKI
ncbi:hypothetical protein GCM10007301_27670 [Azorhizobium oxalatiphilum]|uniref:Membrane-anchored protein n=1 Tax=Azorhizobium oxalatiphilum TaxID=980631 RepID=A0A917FBY8_9HYPH|nr:hypothetical protein [Azorhizobium oxalatiphilum]GGF66443.1 hypothetical protein GCM10007301_27670 [Azorhizobium oxalatiphilum]